MTNIELDRRPLLLQPDDWEQRVQWQWLLLYCLLPFSDEALTCQRRLDSSDQLLSS